MALYKAGLDVIKLGIYLPQLRLRYMLSGKVFAG